MAHITLSTSEDSSNFEMGFYQLQATMDYDPLLSFPGCSLGIGLIAKPLMGAIEIIFGLGYMFAGIKDRNLFVRGAKLATHGLWHTFKGVAWSSLIGPLVKSCIRGVCRCLGKEDPFKRPEFHLIRGNWRDYL